MPSAPHLALARKWRPQRFEDVIGQRGVVETLKNAITTGRLAQAFIFAGPRGVGKTTTARILARALNCVTGPTPEPCGKCDACLEIAEGRDVDVLEIDGATYTGVDAVREVIVEPLAIAPMRDRFKIFIIDEVHRLSKSAFDALLKSIEEPPPYVKFMMATTELHAVPATIQSRSQVFELKALPFSAIRDQLKTVTSREKVKIDDGAIALVARSAEGSMRDALSALDQVLAFTSDRVTIEDVSTVLGLIGRDLQFEIVETVAREDAAAAFTLSGTVVEAGFDLRIVCRELARLVRDLLVIRIDPSRIDDPEIAAEGERDRLKALAAQYSREDLLRAFDLLSRAESEIRYSSQPRHHFEMTLIKWIHLRKLQPLEELLAGGSPGPRPQPSGPRPQASGPGPGPSDPKPQAPGPRSPGSNPSVAPAQRAPADPREPQGTPGTDLKSALLGSIREQNKVFFGMVIAQAQNVAVEGDTVVFTFAPVHKTLRTQLEGKRGWIEHLAQAIAGRKIAVVARDGQPAPPPAAADGPSSARQAGLRDRAKSEPVVQAVLDVFGGEIEDVEEIE
ncbi:MAG TPA: DNA polymerase III subunit gamma/tau [Vicinamibacterales bacterium]|nr:DNA polymerase III subunit gamma/tau [Vicinamibacterales bacterium]